MMVLDPTKHEDKWKNKGCKWQRASKSPDSGNARCTESAAKPASDPYDEYILCRAHRLYTKITDVIGQIDFGEVSLASNALRHITLDR
jgi:hypothetical protein